MPDDISQIVYDAEPTPATFHASDAFYRCMRGPVRSGKSTSMSIEIMRRAREQDPGQDDVRHTRWSVIRNTYRELEDTTIKTWLMWFPEDVFGKMNRQSMVHHIQFGDVDCEVLFRSLDRPEDVAKLLSMELTGAWVNEAREIPKVIIDTLGDRVEQYPPMMDGGCTWGGVMMDTNPPDEDHWWYGLEADPPPDWEFFVQPGALMEQDGEFLPNPSAENIAHLKGGHNYYIKRQSGKRKEYIRVYYCNQFGYAEDGKRVHPEYSDAVHASISSLEPIPDIPLHVGLDFGLTPAAVIGQKAPDGQWSVLKEIVTEDIGIRHFGEMLLLPAIIEEYLDYDIYMWGDPSGTGGSQIDKQTPFEILNAMGLNAMPAPSQDPTLRREALSAPLSRLIDGRPGMAIDPRCRTLRKGLSSKFIYKRVKVVGDEKYHDKPDKNWWSHVCEAAEYMMLGGGEGRVITMRPRKARRRSVPKVGSRNSWMVG